MYLRRESRYLLIMTENYAALRLLQGQFRGHDPVIIFGSSFPKDQQYTQVHFWFLSIHLNDLRVIFLNSTVLHLMRYFYFFENV